VPAADVAVGDDDLVLTMDLPGFSSDEVSIEVQDNVLTVRGERRRPSPTEGTSWVHVERPFGAFERRIAVPKGVDPDRITASLVDGVLSLIVPKPERMKPKAITIGAGSERGQLETAAA
jgi:HSP20 family protein